MWDKIAKYLKKKWYNGARISLGEHNELKNRYMHIRWEETAHSTAHWTTHSRTKQHFESVGYQRNLI